MSDVKFLANTVVIITESHTTSSGIRLLKDRVGLVFGGETYGALDENEIPVVFESSASFIGVEASKLETFKGDVSKVYDKARLYDEIELELVALEQSYKNMGSNELAEVLQILRRELFVDVVCKTYKWTEAEAISTFFDQEAERKADYRRPYAIEPKSEVLN